MIAWRDATVNARLSDRVNLEVQEAFEDLREAEEVVRLYEAKVLPAAELNVKGVPAFVDWFGSPARWTPTKFG